MHGISVRLEGVAIEEPKGRQVVSPCEFNVEAGEFLSIVGPAGCGSSALLRGIAGFLKPTRGRVFIGHEDQSGLGPNRRDAVLVPGDPAFFPRRTVRENLSFGPAQRRWAEADRTARIQDLMTSLGLDEVADQLPAALTKAQKLQAALVRALAVGPKVLLLDDPLAELSPDERTDFGASLRALQQRFAITAIHAGCDPREALDLSDRVAVMRYGRIEQIDRGDVLLDRPKTAFVAGFLGPTNRLAGRVLSADAGLAMIETGIGRFRARNPAQLDTGAAAFLFVRPDAMQVNTRDNAVSAELQQVEDCGAGRILAFETKGQRLLVRCAMDKAGPPKPGGKVSLGFAANAALVLPKADWDRDELGLAAE